MKGLAVGGKPNRPGAPAVRVRTLLLWDGGWKSLTNATPGVGIVVSAATTALATIASLKQSASQTLDLSKLVGKVSGTAFDETGTGLSRDADFAPVLSLVGQALALDQDPVGAIAYDQDRDAYRLATGVPLVTVVEPAIPTPGQTVSIAGLGFDPTPGRSVFWFGDYPAATWSVSADRTQATVSVPAGAYSAPFTLQQPGGVLVTVHPFLKLRGTVGTLAGSGARGYLDGRGAAAQLDRPFGLVGDRAGNLFFVDVQASPRVYRIRKVTPDGSVTTFAGGDYRCDASERANDPEGCNADGIGKAARFTQIENLAIDGTGTYVYASDEGAGRIRKIDTRTGQVTTLRGPDGQALSFPTCTGVSVDAAGNVYVIEYFNKRIQKVSPQGSVTTVASLPTPSFGLRIQADGSGGYVSLYAQHRLGKLTLAGGAFDVTPLAGRINDPGSADGTGTDAQFFYPVTMEYETGGTIVVADTMNGRIRRVTPAGAVTTVAGGAVDFQDGPVGQARFGHLYGIAVDAAGSIYLADEGRIRVLTP